MLACAPQQMVAQAVAGKSPDKAPAEKKEEKPKGEPKAEEMQQQIKEENPQDAEKKDDEAQTAPQEPEVAVAKPVPGDLVQVYGWRETVLLEGITEPLRAKLDTGALTSSVHAEEKELFERDGKKWVRFIMTDPTVEKPVRRKMEAPLVRIAQIKEPGGESVSREVVKLSFQIGERKMRGDFSLNNRSNMLAPVLLGRSIIKDLGWVDSSRTNLADDKIFR